MEKILATVSALLNNSEKQQALSAILDSTLSELDCQVGTIHRLEKEKNLLCLEVQKGLPPFLLDKVANIPVGKGMAGLAAERMEPVQVCNLQTDSSGVARPAAKDTKMEGSLTIPILHNGELQGTLGVAKPIPYEFNDQEIQTLVGVGQLLAKSFVVSEPT